MKKRHRTQANLNVISVTYNPATSVRQQQEKRPVRVKFLRAGQRGTGVPPVNPYGQDARATSKNNIPQGGILPAQIEFVAVPFSAKRSIDLAVGPPCVMW